MERKGFRERIRGFFRGFSISREIPEAVKRKPATAKGIIKVIASKFLTIFRNQYEGPIFKYNLEDIARFYQHDSYVHQAIDKHIDLLFKAGWTLKGKDPDNISYIKNRFRLMGLAVQKPIDVFFIELAEDLVKYSNVFIIKSRGPLDFPGFTVSGINGKNPVNGYFKLPAFTVEVFRDEHGKILKYRQNIPDQNGGYPEFSSEEIIHIYYKKESGQAFGMPFLVAVIDDVKALRQAEEHVLRLLHRWLHPLYQYVVGVDKPGFEGTDEEIAEVEEAIKNAPTDGLIVTPERHKINPVSGVDGGALRVDDYLSYFERRVFTGLGVSGSNMGRGDSNRSSAEDSTRLLLDRVRAYQKILSTFIDEYVIRELLLETNIDSFFDDDSSVSFVFNEIDLDNKVKLENQSIYKYEHNAITENEMRFELGLDPVVERPGMFLNVVTIPRIQAQVQAQLARFGGTTGNPGSEPGQKTTDTKVQPRNQFGKKATAKLKASQEGTLNNVSSAFFVDLKRHYDILAEDVVSHLKMLYMDKQEFLMSEFEPKRIEFLIKLTRDSMIKSGERFINQSVFEASRDLRKEFTSGIFNFSTVSIILRDRHAENIERFMERLLQRISDAIRATYSRNDLIKRVYGVFGSLEYQIRFLTGYEIQKAYNYAYALALYNAGHDRAEIVHYSECAECNLITEFSLSPMSYDKVPPFHSSCSCQLRLKGGEENVLDSGTRDG